MYTTCKYTFGLEKKMWQQSRKVSRGRKKICKAKFLRLFRNDSSFWKFWRCVSNFGRVCGSQFVGNFEFCTLMWLTFVEWFFAVGMVLLEKTVIVQILTWGWNCDEGRNVFGVGHTLSTEHRMCRFRMSEKYHHKLDRGAQVKRISALLDTTNSIRIVT